MSGRATAAPFGFPYADHRTVAEVDRDELFRALRKAEAERVGRVHARVLSGQVPTERLR